MHLLWFRRDLRLTDNEIVTLATADRAEVVPLFIIDPWFYSWADVGKARVRFLFESLARLYPFWHSGHHKGKRSLKNAGFAAYITFKYSLGEYW